MIILNDFLLLNGTSLPMNGSINLTVNFTANLTANVIAENLTGHLSSESSILSQFLPIITLIIGSLLTYFLNIMQEHRKEEKEIRRYEYTLITDILDTAKGEDSQNQMTEYYGKEKRRPLFIKTKNYKLILEFMKSIIDGKATSIQDLEAVRDNLKKKI